MMAKVIGIKLRWEARDCKIIKTSADSSMDDENMVCFSSIGAVWRMLKYAYNMKYSQYATSSNKFVYHIQWLRVFINKLTYK